MCAYVCARERVCARMGVCMRKRESVCVCPRVQARTYGADVCMCVLEGGRLCLELLRKRTGTINFYALFYI